MDINTPVNKRIICKNDRFFKDILLILHAKISIKN